MRGSRSVAVVLATLGAGVLAIAACVGEDPDAVTATSDAASSETSTPGADGSDPSDGASPDAGCAAGDATCDPKACGAAKKDCLGGPCVSGKCGFVEIAKDEMLPWALAVDSDTLYWSDIGTTEQCNDGQAQGSIVKAKYDGTGRTVLASAQKCPFGVVLIGNAVYWTERGTNAFTDGDIRRVNKDGSNPTVLYTPLTEPGNIVTDGTTLFFTGQNGKMLRAPASGLGPVGTMIASGPASAGVHDIGDGKLFFATLGNPGQIRYVTTNDPNDAGPPVTLSVGELYPLHPRYVGGALVWGVEAGNAIRTMPADAGADASALYPNQAAPRSLAVDGPYVYWWSRGQQALWRGRADGVGGPEVVASIKLAVDERYPSIAVGADSVFVGLMQNKRILRVAKP